MDTFFLMQFRCVDSAGNYRQIIFFIVVLMTSFVIFPVWVIQLNNQTPI